MAERVPSAASAATGYPQLAAGHGYAVPRGQDVERGQPHPHPDGHFGRMFPSLPPCDVGDDAIDELFGVFERRKDPQSPSGENDDIPAGFTYLAQFVDHDITFDPTSRLQRHNDPQTLANFRTPRLDLDNLYGSGPRDQPFLYDWDPGPARGVKLLVGKNEGAGRAPEDLPRNHQGRALVGDSRNDENLILAQLHLLFIRFHNAVVERLCGSGQTDPRELLAAAQRIVRWHYQWVVVHELLCKVVGHTVADSVLEQDAREAPAVSRTHYAWDIEPFIPVEFSGAAYRFGHTMVRPDYAINANATEVPILPAAKEPRHLGGFRWLPDDLVIDWSLFFELGGERCPQGSHNIDTSISNRLFALPVGTADGRALPLLNLQRGMALGLPSGQSVADAMHEEVLTAADLHITQVPEPFLQALLDATPLWYYILREASVEHPGPNRKHLGRVGGRIVAEVLVGLLEGDPNSYLSQEPDWRPHLGVTGSDFTMADLIRFAKPPIPPAPTPA